MGVKNKKIGKCCFLSREEYNALPSFLQKKLNKLDIMLDQLLIGYVEGEQLNKFAEKEYLNILIDLLKLWLKYPKELRIGFIASIGLFPTVNDIDFSEKTNDVVKELIDIDLYESGPKKFINRKLKEIEVLLKKEKRE